MLEALRAEVCAANKALPAHGLVLFTWGNVSAIDRERGLAVIKPSGVAYEELTPENMVVTDLEGRVVEGSLNPSSDTPTHLVLYRADSSIGGIVHTHSTYATAFAQSGADIPPQGTTHADYFYGAIPCTRRMTASEIEGEYEKATGEVIAETFASRGIRFDQVPAGLVAGHGPFAWGKDAAEAVHNAAVLEQVAKLAMLTWMRTGRAAPISRELLDRHYLRKHGAGAYYGQGGRGGRV